MIEPLISYQQFKFQAIKKKMHCACSGTFETSPTLRSICAKIGVVAYLWLLLLLMTIPFPKMGWCCAWCLPQTWVSWDDLGFLHIWRTGKWTCRPSKFEWKEVVAACRKAMNFSQALM